MKKRGFDRVKRMLRKAGPAVQMTFDHANEENGKDIVALAKVLIPADTQVSRSLINQSALPDGGVLVDFGPKAKVIEGGPAPRPFKGPTMRATSKSRKARNRKAIRDGLRIAKNA